jgi:selenocysteine lyase/cysteine desulfurase
LRGLAQLRGLQILGVKDPDSPRFAQKGGVIAFNPKRKLPGGIASALAERSGVGVRYGCHCAHLLIKHLLNVPPWAEWLQRWMVIVLPRMQLPGVVRVSLGIGNTEEDVDTLIDGLRAILGGPRATHPHSPSTPGHEPVLSRRALRQQMDEFARATALRVFAELE